MTIPQIEVGLSEIGVFEFGYERKTFITATDFLFEGGSEALFGGVALRNSAFFINSASSAATFKGQAVHELYVDAVSGVTHVDFEVSSVNNGLITSTSRSDGEFTSVLVNQSDLTSQGSSLFNAIYIDPETLVILGRAVVNWAGGWKLGTETHSKGKAEFKLDNAAVGNTLLRSTPTNGDASFKAEPLANALLKAESFGNFTARANAKSLVDWEAFGASTDNLKGLALQNSRMRSTASSEASLKAIAISYGLLRSVGEAVVSFRISAIEHTVLNAEGNAITHIRPGTPVLREMPEAWDVIIRPYENRETTWK